MKKKALKSLIRRYNKLRFTKPKSVYLIRQNLTDHRWPSVMKKMIQSPNPPRLSVYHRNFSTTKTPKYFLLEGSHRSTLAKITGRPVVLRRMTKKSKYIGGPSDPRDFLDVLEEDIFTGRLGRRTKGETWATKPIKVKTVRLKKHSKETKRLYERIRRQLKKRNIKRDFSKEKPGLYFDEWPKSLKDLRSFKVKKTFKKKLLRDF